MPWTVAFDLGLHSFPTPLLWKARHKWVKHKKITFDNCDCCFCSPFVSTSKDHPGPSGCHVNSSLQPYTSITTWNITTTASKASDKLHHKKQYSLYKLWNLHNSYWVSSLIFFILPCHWTPALPLKHYNKHIRPYYHTVHLGFSKLLGKLVVKYVSSY